MNNNLWKPIHDWPEYVVNSSGDVKRISRAQGAKVGRILKTSIYPTSGYRYVLLRRNRFGKHCSIHRLIASAFIGLPPSPTHECNHKNGNKLDNRPCNLEWVTHQENAIHSYKLGLTKKPPTLRGEQVNGCQISESIAQQILDSPKGYGTGKSLARKFNVSEFIVSFIRTRRTWKHLSPKQ